MKLFCSFFANDESESKHTKKKIYRRKEKKNSESHLEIWNIYLVKWIVSNFLHPQFFKVECVYVVFSCYISIQKKLLNWWTKTFDQKKNNNTKIAYNHTFLIQQFVRLVFPFDFALETLERYKLWNSYLFKYTISFFLRRCSDDKNKIRYFV